MTDYILPEKKRKKKKINLQDPCLDPEEKEGYMYIFS